MDEGVKKVVLIVLIVVCLGTAAVILVNSFTGGGGGGGATGPVLMMCGETGEVFEMPRDEYMEKMQEKMGGPGTMPMMPMQGPVGIECDECDGGLAFLAYKDEETGQVRVVGMPQQ